MTSRVPDKSPCAPFSDIVQSLAPGLYLELCSCSNSMYVAVVERASLLTTFLAVTLQLFQWLHPKSSISFSLDYSKAPQFILRHFYYEAFYCTSYWNWGITINSKLHNVKAIPYFQSLVTKFQPICWPKQRNSSLPTSSHSFTTPRPLFLHTFLISSVLKVSHYSQ